MTAGCSAAARTALVAPLLTVVLGLGFRFRVTAGCSAAARTALVAPLLTVNWPSLDNFWPIVRG